MDDSYLQGFIDAIQLSIYKVSSASSKEEALKALLEIKEDFELRKISKIQKMLDESKLL
ncbi:hypothetical protein [Saccharolobus shibatae]|uniref:hypothetical protein n=1 Tax=Saccharolobus shibatae TaxID=2286 RepID=UPI001C47C8CA|nr:hypothetical protein [Saccharolobus shibatae]